MELECGVYSITNTQNSKKYIGSSVKIYERWFFHKYHLKCGNHHNRGLQYDWNKYDKNSFKFEILEYCLPYEVFDLEQKYIEKFNCLDESFGYNKSIAHKSSKFEIKNLNKIYHQMRLKSSILKTLKIQSIEENRKSNSIIEEALKDYFKKKGSD